MEEVPHTSGEATGHTTIESTPTAATNMMEMDVEEHESVRDEPTTTALLAATKSEIKLEDEIESAQAQVLVKEEVESGSANFTEREDGGRGEQESGLGVNNFGAMVTPATTRRTSRDREPYSSEHGDESQPKKRKRNIMNETQVNLMEEALQFDPEMQRSPHAIKEWTDRLNKIVRYYFTLSY